jgi:hypothetical protein
MWPISENFQHPVHCVITGFRREVAEDFALLSYYAANSRTITRCVITLKNAVLRMYNACISISPLCRYCQSHQKNTFATCNNPEAKVRRMYTKRITLSVYCRWVSNNWYFTHSLLLDLYQQHYGLNFSSSTAEFQIIFRYRSNWFQKLDITEQEQNFCVQLSNGKI